MAAPPPVGTVLTGEVVRRAPWGLHVWLPGPGLRGTVDQLYVDDDPGAAAESWPAPGTTVRAVVQRYRPDGELRLSLRRSDVEQGFPADGPAGEG